MGRRRVWGAIAIGMVAAALLPVGGSAAQTGDGTSVSADRDGWWSRSNAGAQTPDGALTPPIPRSPAVPQGAVAVSALLGQPQTVAGIGIVIPEGMQATSLVMTLALADSNNADSNGSQAKIVACPVTSFWGATDNGKWEDRPEADCGEAKAEGKRNDDGSWTFDLTPIASLWADPFEVTAQNGVLLTEDAGTAATYQVAFEGLPDGITFEAELTEMMASDGAFTSIDSGGGSSSSGGGSSFSSGSGSVDTGPLPEPSAPAGDTGRETASSSGGQQATGRLAASRDGVGNIAGNRPPGIFLLIPVALAVAVLAGQSVSGGRARSQHLRRQGGVGRALATRSTLPVPRARPEMP